MRKSSLQRRRRRRRRRCGWELHCTAVAAAESIRENADLRKRDLNRNQTTSSARQPQPSGAMTRHLRHFGREGRRSAVVTKVATRWSHRLRLILNRNRDGTDIITLHSSVASRRWSIASITPEIAASPLQLVEVKNQRARHSVQWNTDMLKFIVDTKLDSRVEFVQGVMKRSLQPNLVRKAEWRGGQSR